MSFFDKVKGWFAGKTPTDDTAGAASAAAPEPEKDPEPAPSPAPDFEPNLASRPRQRWTAKDDVRIEAEARARFEEGDAAGGIAALADNVMMFARHDDTASLPCLCAKCLRPEVGTAEAHGVPFVRDFVVTELRALFYWTPAELAGDFLQVRASMRSELRKRLRVLGRKEEPRQAINPFTKEIVTILPSEDRRVRINPFTGKPVP